MIYYYLPSIGYVKIRSHITYLNTSLDLLVILNSKPIWKLNPLLFEKIIRLFQRTFSKGISWIRDLLLAKRKKKKKKKVTNDIRGYILQTYLSLPPNYRHSSFSLKNNGKCDKCNPLPTSHFRRLLSSLSIFPMTYQIQAIQCARSANMDMSSVRTIVLCWE